TPTATASGSRSIASTPRAPEIRASSLAARGTAPSHKRTPCGLAADAAVGEALQGELLDEPSPAGTAFGLGGAVDIARPAIIARQRRTRRIPYGAAEAQYAELKVRLESQHLDQEAAAASVQADYAQARMRADTDQQLADQGLVADLNRKLSRVSADQLENRNRIEQRRLAIAGDSIKAQLAGQQAQVEQKRVLARLRRNQVKAQAVRAGIGGML